MMVSYSHWGMFAVNWDAAATIGDKVHSDPSARGVDMAGSMTAQDWLGVATTLATFGGVLILLGFVGWLAFRR
jgi:hypothetical protein